MKKLYLPIIALALALQPMARAHAQTQSTPQQLQAMIAAGQEQTALKQLNSVLQAHPDSGVAWYLVAEAQDASGNETAARNALAKAEQYAPGLPFANQQKTAALRAHLAAPAPVAPQEHH
ncbi:MAG: tetratricopeptide repeat protein, partial [Acidocella sp.]|nr:tetratricopeptide repeat protein [Acidocella sp.]